MRRLWAWLTALVTGRRRGVAREIAWTVTVNGRVVPTFEKGRKHMAALLMNDQQADVVVEFPDFYGNPSRVDGKPTWQHSDSSLGTLNVSADGMMATYIPSGPLGVDQITVTADADLGAGVRTISGSMDLQIEAGGAQSVRLIFGTPRPK